jgi:8-oxo-dGTP diphosphatase
MTIAVDARGNELLSFDADFDLDARDPDIPLPLALAVARDARRTLVVFNRRRREWELPGGLIDPGESPQQAAVREFAEETGQRAQDVAYLGLATRRMRPDRRLEYGAVYRVDIADERLFVPNDEIERIRWWDGSPLSDLSPIDAELIHRLRISGGGPTV